MKLKVLDIPEEGIDLGVTAASDAWFRDVLKDAFREDYRQEGGAQLDLHLLRTLETVQMFGKAGIGLRPSCARCLDPFDRRLELDLQVNMVPEKDMHIGGDDEGVELDAEDVGFSFYKGEEIDLAEILREFLVLEMPIRCLCSEGCKGLCSQCGQNLNVATCTCAPAKGDPRFAILKQLKK